MKHRFFSYSLISIIGILLIVLAVPHYFPPKPLFSDFLSSQAVYDASQQHLLRLTLASDGQYRLYTPLKAISPLLIQATLLQEDRYFYQHSGVNPIALIKAAWHTYGQHSRRMGASTITMQVARLYFKINSKTPLGKITQILRALELEFWYSKSQILEAYLNLAPYGGNIEGVGAASLIYFGKPANQIRLPEALLLSVIPQNPNKRAPLKPQHIIPLQQARLRLFQAWLEQHPQDSRQQAVMQMSLQWLKPQRPFLAPHFVNDVLQQTPHQPLIIATLDFKLQQIVARSVQHYLTDHHDLGVNNVAVLLIDSRDMTVKALIGSGNFFDAAIHGQINGTLAQRSPGSSLKPFIYALALDQGVIHPYTVLKDAPTAFGAYNPENFDRDFMGPIKAKDALILSRNIPALYLMNQLTQPTFYQFLKAAHISRLKSANYYGLSLALGGGEVTMQELVTLYAMLINNGVWQPLRWQSTQTQLPGNRLLSPEAAFLVLDMLKDTPRPNPVQGAATPSLPVYWKTGTSSGYRDAWSTGIFGPYVLSVWIGNFSGKGNPAYVGIKTAAPLFFDLVASINRSNASHSLSDRLPDPKQLHLTRVAVCTASGLLPTRYCPSLQTTWFIPGKSPIKTDDIYRAIPINQLTGLRTCHFDQNTRWAVYEFWPSDLLAIFNQAGIHRNTPPPFENDCNAINTTGGRSPQIISPQAGFVYTLRLDQPLQQTITLSASTDADVNKLYWFANNELIGVALHGQILSWRAKPGHYLIRVIDDHGRFTSRALIVEDIN